MEKNRHRCIRLIWHLVKDFCINPIEKPVWNVVFLSHNWKSASSREETLSMLSLCYRKLKKKKKKLHNFLFVALSYGLPRGMIWSLYKQTVYYHLDKRNQMVDIDTEKKRRS